MIGTGAFFEVAMVGDQAQSYGCLRSAMNVAARTLGLEDDIGGIQEGYATDVITVEGDPAREHPPDGARPVRDVGWTGGEGSVGRGAAGLQAATARRRWPTERLGVGTGVAGV